MGDLGVPACPGSGDSTAGGGWCWHKSGRGQRGQCWPWLSRGKARGGSAPSSSRLPLRLPVLSGCLRGPAEWTTPVHGLGTRLGPAEPCRRQASAVVGSAGPKPPPPTALPAGPAPLRHPHASPPPPSPLPSPLSFMPSRASGVHPATPPRWPCPHGGAWSRDAACAALRLTWTPPSPEPPTPVSLASPPKRPLPSSAGDGAGTRLRAATPGHGPASPRRSPAPRSPCQPLTSHSCSTARRHPQPQSLPLAPPRARTAGTSARRTAPAPSSGTGGRTRATPSRSCQSPR